MKDYNEMAAEVFRRRDEYLTARKKRNVLLFKTAGTVCAVLLVAVAGISLWKNLPDIPFVEPTAPTASTADASITNNTQNTEFETNTQTASSQMFTTEPEETRVTVLPPDPTEPSVSNPEGDTKPTYNPSTSPSFPVDPTEELQPPTQATDSTEGGCLSPVPTEPPWDEPPTACPTEVPSDIYTGPTDPTMSELYIECGTDTIVAEVGDVITVTVEMQADELLGYLSALLKYDSSSRHLSVVNETGLTTYQKNALHVPCVDPDFCYINYKYNTTQNKGIKVQLDGDYESLDFRDKKVLFTFSFDVVRTGYTKIELEVDAVKDKDGKDYYLNGELVNPKNITFDMHVSKKQNR